MAASKRSITEGTRDGYEDHFIKRLRPAFGELPLRKLNTFEVIDDAVSEWDECGDWAPKTINNTLGALSSFLSDMVRQGKAAQNGESPDLFERKCDAVRPGRMIV